MEVKCLFGLFPNEYLSEIQNDTISGMQNAANNFQWGIVNGLDSYKDINLSIINSMYIGSYPKRYRRILIPTFSFAHTEGSKDINVGFLNLPIIKVLSRYVGIKKYIRDWQKTSDDDNHVIVAYAMTFPFVQVLRWVKKKYAHIHCCLVVPDLPEYMNASAMDKKWYIYAKKIQKRIIFKCINKVDSFVLLTDKMKEWFDKPVKYTVVEGISRAQDSESVDLGSKKKSIFYSGMIEEKYGIVDLVRSFISIGLQDWTLEIYGDGSAIGQIKKLAENHSNINIHGLVSNSEVVAAQKQAGILVNPRRNDQIFTKYSFPSKIIEYMSSGTPMLSYELDGMPKEYSPYFYRISEEESGLSDSLMDIVSLSSEERQNMGRRAKEFIMREKNPKKQCEKILSLFC